MAEVIPTGSDDEVKLLIEGELGRVLVRLDGTPLGDVCRYGVFPGGKRVRPLLALNWCADLGGDPMRILPAAAALELLHCASLIHDDLPALDNDDFRRGRPACHRAYGESQAILAGDALVSLALECAAEVALEGHHALAVVRAVAKAYTDLCSGQALDLEKPPVRSDLGLIHRYKTGALFAACFEIGAIGAGGDARVVAESIALGLSVGLAFQIGDDLLDRHGTDAERGRPGSSGARNGKANFFSEGNDSVEPIFRATEREIGALLGSVVPGGARRVAPRIAAVLKHVATVFAAG
jgi:geranylgeranyl diphosphate synthase type II